MTQIWWMPLSSIERKISQKDGSIYVDMLADLC